MDRVKTSLRLQKILILALFTAAGIILSWLERLIPLPAVIPGLKIGLANVAVVVVLRLCGLRGALLVSLVRILAVNLLFGSLSGLLYAICGALLSLMGMWALGHCAAFGVAGISAVGGVLHNIGQIGAACLLVQSTAPVAYLPVLAAGGAVFGFGVGLVGAVLVKRLQPLTEKYFAKNQL